MRFTEIMGSWRLATGWPVALGGRTDKLTLRMFALSHGCPVPELYWVGRSRRLPAFFPPSYVLKPVYGHSSRDVYLVREGRDLLRGIPADEIHFEKDEPVLAEELLDAGGLDYKFWMVQDHVATIQVIERRTHRMQFYDREWNPGLNVRSIPREMFDERRPPPDSLEDMILNATRLGAAFGSFVRIDMYATPGGCVFGELTTTPNALNGISEEGDLALGRLLEERGLSADTYPPDRSAAARFRRRSRRMVKQARQQRDRVSRYVWKRLRE